MPLRKPAHPPAEPRTVIGQWLLAGLLHQREIRQQLSRRLNGGREGWNYDEPAVVEIACELAARRYFQDKIDVRAISLFVTELRGRVHSTDPPNQLEAEALVRRALGDLDVMVVDIPVRNVFNIQGAVLAQAAYKLGFNPSDRRELVVEAERLAFERGWNPPLAA